MDVEQDAASAFLENAKRNIDVSFESIGVLPGERVTESVTTLKSSIRIGAGLVQINDAVITTVAGKLRYRPPATYFVESTTMRYMPKAGDHVVAIVDEKGGDFYKVNIFSGAMGMLGRLSFDGATKRNKPELKKGDYIYARVLQANKDVDTELTCTAASGVKKDWSSGESIFGELAGGLLVRVSLFAAKKLLSPDCAVLSCLSRHFAFEVAIGANGLVWINASDARSIVVIRNSIINATSVQLSDAEVEIMVQRLVTIAKSHREDEE